MRAANPAAFCCLSATFHVLDLLHSGKGEVLPYSLPSVRPGADPGVQAVSPQVTF